MESPPNIDRLTPAERTDLADEASGLVESWGEGRTLEEYAALIDSTKERFERAGITFFLPQVGSRADISLINIVEREYNKGGDSGIVIRVISPGVLFAQTDTKKLPSPHLKAKVIIVG